MLDQALDLFSNSLSSERLDGLDDTDMQPSPSFL
jgi:hypothetical protein